MQGKVFKVALAGNPNSGKTSLFNVLTGLNHKVGNFPGVTVDKKTATIKLDKMTVTLVDLPGTYSIYPKSLDEAITAEVLANPQHPDYPDGVLIVADATNFKRSLLLTTQIIDLGIPSVLVLNMMDLSEKSGQILDLELLSETLQIPVVGINARDANGINALKELLSNLPKQGTPPSNFSPPTVLASETDLLCKKMGVKASYQAFQWLAAGHQYQFNVILKPLLAENNISQSQLRQIEAKETVERYKKIAKLLQLVIKEKPNNAHLQSTLKIDRLLLHPIGGYLVFISIFLVVFQALFSWSELPMTFIESGFGWLGNAITDTFPDHWFKSLVVDGLLAGLSGVLVFIPQIMLLFGFLAILEDTGYMARVSFLLDKLMRSVGLGGRSVVSLVSGFACAVPAIMAARSIGNWKERLLTIMVTPLMSCSARLPVYTLLVSIAIPNTKLFGFLSLQALVLLAFYLLGFLGALVVAKVLSYVIKSEEKSMLALELPLYREPRWKNVSIEMFNKVRTFVTEAGKIILSISVILWALSTYGPNFQEERAKNAFEHALTIGLDTAEAEKQMAATRLANSYAGILGKSIEPVIEPLGFDWKIGIALITSFAAREVFVGTMATIYASGDDDSNLDKLRSNMRNDINPNTQAPLFSLPVALALMVFYAFAMQCMSTVAIVIKETGGWKYAMFQLTYLSLLAYGAAFLTYKLFS